MSEETKPEKSFLPSGSDEQMIDVIKEDAIVSIQMSTGFYKRVQQIIGTLLENKSINEIQESHKIISEKNSTSQPWIYNYETLLILCKEFEKVARADGKIDKMTLGEARELIAKAEARENNK
jgi:hypothetical protein